MSRCSAPGQQGIGDRKGTGAFRRRETALVFSVKRRPALQIWIVQKAPTDNDVLTDHGVGGRFEFGKVCGWRDSCVPNLAQHESSNAG